MSTPVSNGVPAADPDTLAIQGFLRRLFGAAPQDAGFLVLTHFPNGPVNPVSLPYTLPKLDAAGRKAAELATRWDVYFGCGLQGPRPRRGTRGGSETVSVIPGFWMECDAQTSYRTAPHPPKKAKDGKTPLIYPPNKAELRTFLDGLPLPPSLLVDSGGGLHAWWILKEPWHLETPEEWQRADQLSRGWQRYVQGAAEDYGYWWIDTTADLARILRLPGTLNWKSGTGIPVIVASETTVRYVPDDFDDFRIPVERPVTGGAGQDAPWIPETDRERTRARTYALRAIERECDALAAMPENSGRNNALNAAAFKLQHFAAAGAVTENELVAALTAAALASGLDPKETATTIRSGLTKGATKSKRALPDLSAGTQKGNGKAARVQDYVGPDLPDEPPPPPEGFGDAYEPDELLTDPPVTPAPDPGEDLPVFVLLSVLRQNPKLLAPPTFAIPRMGCQGRGSLLAGPEKKGKSTLMAQLAADKSRGRRCLGEPTTPGNIIWCGIEEALDDAVRRFDVMDADPDRIQVCTSNAPADPFGEVRAILQSWPTDVVFFDSLYKLARLVLGRAPESGDAAVWGDIVRPLVDLSREFGVTSITSHHARRSDGSYRDSSEIGAAFDAIFTFRLPKPGEAPNLRHIEGEGRWYIEPFDVAYLDGRYDLSGGRELSLDALLLIHIENEPGVFLNRLVDLVKKRKQTVSATLNQLEARGAIENRGSKDRAAYYPPSPQHDLEGV